MASSREESFPRAVVSEKNGEVSCSVQETNRIREQLGLKPLRIGPKQPEQPVVKAKVTEKNGEISCSVEETNRIRALLGLKPLRTVKSLDKPKETRETNKSEAERRILLARSKRQLSSKPEGRSLAEDQHKGESALDWIQRTRTIAVKEEDEEKQKSKPKEDTKKRRDYSSTDLEGLKVAHDLSQVAEGEGVILTLKDQEIIDKKTRQLAEEEDELENTRLKTIEKEALRGSKRRRKKKLLDMKMDNDEMDVNDSVLSKYDEFLVEEGLQEAKAPAREFRVSAGLVNPRDVSAMDVEDVGNESEQVEAAVPLASRIEKHLKDKETAASAFKSMFHHMPDYYTQEEMDELEGDRKKLSEKEKKKKKKKKKRDKDKTKKRKESGENKADGVEEMGDDAEEAPLLLLKRSSKTKGRSGIAGLANEDDDRQIEEESRLAKLVEQQGQRRDLDTSVDLASEDGEEEEDDDRFVLSSTTGFSNTIQTRLAEHTQQETPRPMSSSSSSSSSRQEISTADHAIFASPEEAKVDGVAAALQFLGSRGDLRTQDTIVVGRANDAKPIKDLLYLDEEGRLLTQKEAFRQQNYKFHGQKPGLKRQAKRLRELQRQKQSTTSGRLDELQKKKQQQSGASFLLL